ncbi:uncharacterized protein LOC125212553 isoform X2 [Salvia hispanica]|nr:uncharacterized protein LOC125212553 isoform X2 [Salvia hispanica]
MGSGGADEEWVNAAMTDDAMVVDLLVRLHRAPLEWSVRQRRSKVRKAGRSSPSTPLSLSSSASHDFKLSTSTTSKSNNVDGEKTNSKRSRKKKTLAELKDEESSLLKERRELKREMAALRMNLERQRATHERLKRMKIDLQPSQESTSVAEESVSGQQLQMASTACDAPPVVSGSDVCVQSSVSNARCNGNADAASGSKFILPDLNVPFDEPS